MKKIYSTFSALAIASLVWAESQDATHVNVQSEKSSFQYFFNTSFIYWYGKEEGLDLGKNAILTDVGKTFNSPNGEVLKQGFSYNPGFKVGAGLKNDDWELRAEYTWLQSISQTSKNAPENKSNVTGIGVWSSGDWFLQLSSFGQPPVATNIHSDLHIGLNLFNLLGTHPLYSHNQTRIVGAFGLLAAKIDQKINVYMPDAVTAIVVPTGRLFIPPKDISSYNHSDSWGIGPKACLETQYFLGKGLRIEGNVAASLLYMRYTSVKHTEELIFEFSPVTPLIEGIPQSSMNVFKSPYGSVRPVLELSLGLGWNKEFSEGKYRLDLSSTYDFSFFWSQNVIREMLDESYTGSGSSPGNLYFQGLTVTACFAF